MAEIGDILTAAAKSRASDVLLTPHQPPGARIDGSLRKLPGFPVADAAECRRWIFSAMTPAQQKEFEAEREMDFAFSLRGVGRFRVNVFLQAYGTAAAFRYIPTTIPSPEQIGLNATILGLCNLPRGLVLVTGPTGSGKTSTLAALIDRINATQSKHILTIEDPIEFLYQNKNSIVNQREVGQHTGSFSRALKYALRQNPDIILVGEMRDRETMALALAAAETGHLCFSTLHTQDAASTVNRIIDEFPHEQQHSLRTLLGSVLSAVVSQVLLPKPSGGLVCAREIMIMNPAIGSLIRENKIAQIYGAIETGSSAGMMSLDQDLVRLTRSGQINMNDALSKAHDPQSFRRLSDMTSPPPVQAQDFGAFSDLASPKL
ncbi:MAG TPA: type IV pilus twitching motility protein PilT [Elusimicrobiota bacterium]|nr:type IV pilus twitching motility protein PilT [Elusimicrobiota bacterium]